MRKFILVRGWGKNLTIERFICTQSYISLSWSKLLDAVDNIGESMELTMHFVQYAHW